MNTRIKELRTSLRLTQTEFADKLGLTPSAISKMESGDRVPAENTIKLICKTYHISYLWLTEGKSPMYEQGSGDALIDRYAPEADERTRSAIHEMAKLPEEAWSSLRDYINYMLQSVDSIRAHEEDK